jgi:hypothetical protein
VLLRRKATGQRLRACATLAAAVLLVACAGQMRASPAASDYRPAPRSTLVSSSETGFVVAQWQSEAEVTTVLARQMPGPAPDPVARLVWSGRGALARVSVQWLPGSERASGSADQTAAVEQVYAHVLRQEPQARYCLGASGDRLCDPVRGGVSHAEVLRLLVDARDRSAQRTTAAIPWRVVELSAAPSGSWDADLVGVRATISHVPLEGVAIHFDRAPHSSCVARTRADGMAVCRLVDQHGDEHEHDHAASVVATFPGDVQRERVVPPTTFVLPAPPFARLPSLRLVKP